MKVMPPRLFSEQTFPINLSRQILYISWIDFKFEVVSTARVALPAFIMPDSLRLVEFGRTRVALPGRSSCLIA
ncbi:hypothetical protein SLEP1_g44720 [Rubroshorea leprosula]|uniref:Uncharacterized protein n=1 Tax=Rubroshorea leprosula TaxID=152421 RepID=A0AAV5LI79_9ROSI|nr:hypothetical protein SLEP1_g44720 [Rubroshorea leprosula]